MYRIVQRDVLSGRGSDLVRSQDWIYALPSGAIDEIDASLRRLDGRNAYAARVERSEFPLTSIAEGHCRYA